MTPQQICIGCSTSGPLTLDDGITLLVGFLGIAGLIITMYLVLEIWADKQERKKPKDALANFKENHIPEELE